MSEESGPSTETVHVLAVDDDELVRLVLVRQLEQLGYRATGAASAAETLDALAANSDITILLTDVRLQDDVDGYTLATRCRAIQPSLRVVFMSGLGVPEPLGADGPLLRKPFTQADLARAVATALR